MMLLSIKEIDVVYGKALALDGVSLEIEEGKIVSIIGANGSGKTTLLHLAKKKFSHAGKGKAVYCQQRTDWAPEGLDQFLSSFDKDSYKIKAMLEIESEISHPGSNCVEGC